MMAENDRQIYCPRCGRMAGVSDKFCGACGAAIPSDARSAAPDQTSPAQTPSGNLRQKSKVPLLIGLGVAALLLVLVGTGTIVALTLMRSELGNLVEAVSPSKPAKQEEVGPVGQEVTEENSRDVSEKTGAKPPDPRDASTANPDKGGTQQEREVKPPVDNSGLAPGYNLVQDPSGGLQVEVPSGWGVETGADSENEGGPGSWSYFAGEYLHSSITTASSLDAWYEGPGASGAYMAASKALARDYTDYELTHSLLHEGKEQNCTPGPYEDLDRESYLGKVQAWFDCGLDGATS